MKPNEERDTKSQEERETEGGYLLFDVNLGQALQLGGVFWYIYEEQKNHTANTGLIGLTYMRCFPSVDPAAVQHHCKTLDH